MSGKPPARDVYARLPAVSVRRQRPGHCLFFTDNLLLALEPPTLRRIPQFLLASSALLLACKGGGQRGRTRPVPLIAAAEVRTRDVPVEIRAPVDLRPLAQAEVG